MLMQKDTETQGESKPAHFYGSRTDPSSVFAIRLIDVDQKPENVITENGIEYELIEDVSLDWDAVPDFTKNELASAAFKAFQRFMTRPDARAVLDRERELLRQEGSTLLEPRKKLNTSPEFDSPARKVGRYE